MESKGELFIIKIVYNDCIYVSNHAGPEGVVLSNIFVNYSEENSVSG